MNAVKDGYCLKFPPDSAFILALLPAFVNPLIRDYSSQAVGFCVAIEEEDSSTEVGESVINLVKPSQSIAPQQKVFQLLTISGQLKAFLVWGLICMKKRLE